MNLKCDEHSEHSKRDGYPTAGRRKSDGEWEWCEAAADFPFPEKGPK